MTDLEQLELVLRRIHARREHDHQHKDAPLNVDVQELLTEIAGELALASHGARLR